MLFQQTAAPTGWTKQTALNDYGLRVTSGTAGVVAGNAFSTVFAQNAVGNTTLTLSQMPPHSHLYQQAPAATTTTGGGAFPAANTNIGVQTDIQGGGLAHTHSVNLALSYVDVIIAAKN
jgi:microcystin-dependent protein